MKHPYAKRLLIIIFIAAMFMISACDPSYRLFVVNKSGQQKNVSVICYPWNVDSLRFFSADEKINDHSVRKSQISKPVQKNTDSTYTFEIEDDQATLLMPLGIATSIRGVIVDGNTVMFDTPDGHFNKRDFKNRSFWRYIYTIE